MLDFYSGWAVGVVVSLLVGAVVAWLRGAELGMGAAIVVSFLFPAWLKPEIFGAQFGIRTTVAAVALAVYAVRFPRRIPSRLNLLDAAVAALVVVHTLADMTNGVGWSTPLVAYGEWALPYVAARFTMRDREARASLAYWVCAAVVVWSVGALAEMVSSTNLWEAVFGPRIGEAPRDATRFGLKRAYGNCVHPIFFGMQIVAMLPWPLWLAGQQGSPSERQIGLATLAAGFVGCLATVSRGPVLAFLMVLGMALVYRHMWARWAAGAAVVALGFLLVTNPVKLMGNLADMVGQKTYKTQIELDGEKLPWNGTVARLWVIRGYAPAVAAAGPLGYGTPAAKFPVNVPHLPTDPHTLEALRWIDNEYILIGLRFGWLGIVAIAGFFITNTVVGARFEGDAAWNLLAAWTAAMMATFTIALMTVWLSYDFGFEVLWMSGVLSGLIAWAPEGYVPPHAQRARPEGVHRSNR